ncbi:MAG: SGNH/GDSL hydrolase family protein [Chloroflexota bacterium]|nr:SGNH/GDSL hydrolase family protein [Chloroflexota bacterium]
MSFEDTNQPSDSGARLSRNLVRFALALWLPLLIAWFLLLFSPVSPAQAYEQMRRVIVVGAGLATALAFAGGIWAFRFSETMKAKLAGLIMLVFGSGRMALFLLLALVEFNILTFILLRDIAPSITSPFRFLLVCWSAVFAALMLAIHWPAVRRTVENGRDLLALLGFTIVALLVLAIVFILNSRLISSTDLYERLRGALDYRPLQFVEDGQAPSAGAFWAEQSSTRVRWLPYSYWTVAPFDGNFINVDEGGRRRSPVHTDAPAAERIYFFGGSTMWGYGARDEYTIPAQVEALLSRRDMPVQASNFAQPGYVSWQDLLLFQAQLALDNAPELAVFYHGFNDVYAAYLQGRAGLTLRENQRANDVELGRLLRSGQPVLMPFEAEISQYDWSLITRGAATAWDIADRLLANQRLIRAAAIEHDVRVLFVLQPALFAKSARTAAEQRILDDVESAQPGFIDLYREVERIIREAVSDGRSDDMTFLTELFRDVSDGIFFDRVHINEIGNRHVAEALVAPIADAQDGQ